MQKEMPINKNVVFSMFLLSFVPLNILDRRDNAYPAKKPINNHSSSIVVIKLPWFNVRIMIIATISERNKTTINELMIENQLTDCAHFS